MPVPGSRRICREFTGSVENVGSADSPYLFITFSDVPRGWLRQVDVKVTAGTSILNVDAILSKSSDNSGTWDEQFSTGGLVTQPVSTVAFDNGKWIGTPDNSEHKQDLYMLVRVDDATTDHTVQAKIVMEMA